MYGGFRWNQTLGAIEVQDCNGKVALVLEADKLVAFVIDRILEGKDAAEDRPLVAEIHSS